MSFFHSLTDADEFVMRTPTVKTLWDRIVVLAKLVFPEMDILAKVEEVL